MTTITDPETATPEAEAEAEAEVDEDPRPCDECGEPGTTDDLPLHGSCLLAQGFGHIAEILTPEDVATGLTDVYAGMSPRESGEAVELILAKAEADSVLRRSYLGDVTLDERRIELAYVVGIVTENFDRLAALDPKLARKVRLKLATRELVGLMLDDVGDQVDDLVADVDDKADDDGSDE